MSDWTDELKQEVIQAYQDREPTPENSAEIVKELAEEYDKTPNGVRMILTKAEVYVKKAAATASKGEGSSGGTRVNKAQAIAELKELIEAQGADVDDAIVDKLTGKAAVYFKDVLNKVIGD